MIILNILKVKYVLHCGVMEFTKSLFYDIQVEILLMLTSLAACIAPLACHALTPLSSPSSCYSAMSQCLED